MEVETLRSGAARWRLSSASCEVLGVPAQLLKFANRPAQALWPVRKSGDCALDGSGNSVGFVHVSSCFGFGVLAVGLGGNHESRLLAVRTPSVPFIAKARLGSYSSFHRPCARSRRRSRGLLRRGQKHMLLAFMQAQAESRLSRPPTSLPDLGELQRGDADAWDAAFDWLWPIAFSVARLKLQPFFPEDVEDVAIEALEELVEKVRQLRSSEELKPLTGSIAHHRAVSLLRERFAKKRGAGRTESIDGAAGSESLWGNHADAVPPLLELDQGELAGLLRDLQRDLKEEHRAVLDDFFLHRLSYEEIARKHDLAMGSVGVYLKRGLETLRKACLRRPGISKELEAFLR